MATESSVKVAPDGSGKDIDTVTVVADDGVTRYRQAVTLGDGTSAGNFAQILGGSVSVKEFSLENILREILVELRVINSILAATQNSRDDPISLRKEEFLQMNLGNY